MVQTLSLVGAAFAVGGSYFALDSLRDVLIAKSINTPVATRLAMASAAVIGGLFLFGRSEGSAAGQRAKETVKEDIIAKIEAASEQFAAEPDDPNYMVKSDIHKIAESGIRMTVLIDEYPDADLPIWLKSKLSVTASEADGVADNMGYALADPEAFDAEGRGSRRDLGRFSRPRKPSAGYYRRKGRRAALSSLFSADSNGAVDLTVEAICNNEYCDFCSVARHDDSNDYGLKYWFLSQMTDVACIGVDYPGEIEKTWRGLLDLEPCSDRTQIGLLVIPCPDPSCATCKIDRLETMDEIADLLLDTAQEIADQKSRQEILAAWRRAMGYTDGCPHASKTSKKSAESDDWPADVELAIGTHEELEHTDNAGEARRIAQDHLDENPNYYEILASAGLVGRNLPPNRVAQTIRQVVALNTQERGRPAGNAWIWTPLFHPRTSEDAMAQVINIVAAIPDDGGMFHHSQFPSQEWAYLDDDSGMLHLITVSTHSGWKHLMVNIVQGTAKQSTIPMGFMRMIGRERRARSAFTDKNAEGDEPESVKVRLLCAPGDPTFRDLQLFLARVKGMFLPNDQAFTENVWVRLQQGDENQGIGYIDNVPANTKYKLGQLIQWDCSFEPPLVTILQEPPITVDRDDYYDAESDDDDGKPVPDKEPRRGAPDLWFSESSDPYCNLYEKTQRWDDGRYRCWDRKGHAGRCSAWSRSGSGKESFDGYPPCEHIKAGQMDCGCILGDGVDDSIGARLANHPLFKKKSAEYDQPIPAAGTPFTCDCGAECTVDADTEIAYGSGSYDLRCGRNDDCRGDEKVLGAESSDSDILILRDNLNTGYIGYLWQFKNSYGTDDLDEIRRMVKAKDDLERVPRWNRMSIGPKTVAKVDRRKTPLPVDFNRDSQFKDAEASRSYTCAFCGDGFVDRPQYATGGMEGEDFCSSSCMEDYYGHPSYEWCPDPICRHRHFDIPHQKPNAGEDWGCKSCHAIESRKKSAEVFEAFSLSDRPVSVKFGPGTSGNAKMKATFTDASGDTKTTQFGYRGMSDYTKHKDADRRSAYLARHGSKAQGENWKDPTTAGALSRYVLWEKTSLPAAKSAFKKRFSLRAEGDDADTYVGYQISPFITEWDRLATWTYEPDYSITEESL